MPQFQKKELLGDGKFCLWLCCRNSRPGTVASLQFDKKPDNLTTVFAGVDKESTQKKILEKRLL